MKMIVTQCMGRLILSLMLPVSNAIVNNGETYRDVKVLIKCGHSESNCSKNAFIHIHNNGLGYGYRFAYGMYT